MKTIARLSMLVSMLLMTFQASGETPTPQSTDILILHQSAQLAIAPGFTDANREFFVDHILQTLTALPPAERVTVLDSVLETLDQSERAGDVQLLGSEVIGAACLIGIAYLSMRSAKKQVRWGNTVTVVAVAAAALGSLVFAERDANKLRGYIKSVRDPLVELRESVVLNQRVEQLR